MSDLSQNQELDLSFLYEIADGSNEFIVESIAMFLDQTPDLLTGVDEAISVGSWPTAASMAHKLKPNLGFFGMLDCQEMIKDVELSCKAGGEDPAKIRDTFNQVNVMIRNAMVKLAKVKAEKESEL